MSKTVFVNIDELFKTYKLSFDADGVLINSGASVINVFNDLFKTHYRLEDVHGWFVIAEWAILAGASETEALDLNERLWTDPEILFQSPPVSGAVEFTEKIYKQGSDFSVITSRTPRLKESTFAWFQKWMPWIDPKKIHIRENNKIQGEIFKAKKIRELNVRIHFEDGLDHTRIILDHTNACVVLIPYTREVLVKPTDQVIQMPILNNEIPNFHSIYTALRSKDFYVAQY